MSYSVTYAANGASSGAVPVDATAYTGGESATVLANSGALARVGYNFTGWNTAADGSGFARAPAAVFTMPAANVVLYAQWALASLVTLAAWKKYAKKPDEDAEGEALYQTFLDGAEAIVEDYLGYDPVSQTYTAQELLGTGFDSLQLKAKPISALTSLSVDGVMKTPADYRIQGERIMNKNGEIFPKGSVVLVTYTAGYTTVPGLVALTIMDIASLLSMNQGENIGVSSVTFDGGNTRQFINYNRFDKQLSRLANIRLVRPE